MRGLKSCTGKEGPFLGKVLIEDGRLKAKGLLPRRVLFNSRLELLYVRISYKNIVILNLHFSSGKNKIIGISFNELQGR